MISSEGYTINGINNNGDLLINNQNAFGDFSKTPFLIGVAGGTASGKTTVCERIIEKLGQGQIENHDKKVICISQDSFYKDIDEKDKLRAEKGLYNFDHPDAVDSDTLLATLKAILAGEVCEIPVYDFKSNSRKKNETIKIYPADVVLVEGILVFYYPEIRNLFHLKLFVDTDSDTRLARRVPRDINERCRDLEQVLYQYIHFVKPAFEEFCFPTKKFADVIIPRGAENIVAINLIVHRILDILLQKNGKFHCQLNSDTLVR